MPGDSILARMDAYSRLQIASLSTAYAKGRAPTDAQAKAGNYLKGRITLQGLPIAIEIPPGHYRRGKDANGKEWRSLMQFAYGHFEKCRGNDGDGLDVFIGPFPENESVWVVNQRSKGGGFDEHKVMFGFMSEADARSAYLNSYEAGWDGLDSITGCTVDQLKWWMKNGDKSVPLTAKQLPFDGTPTMDAIAWNLNGAPANIDMPGLMYRMRQEDSDGLLLDAVAVADVLEDADETLALDALVVPMNKLERKMQQLQAVMVAAGEGVKPVAMQVTPPFKQRGTTNVAAIFEMSDGQTVTVFLHNPDTTPNKLAPADELISWKWLLNKKDVTILVAPEKGEDLNPREVGRRIMRVAEKNSAKFAQANRTRAERMASIQGMKDGITAKEAELGQLQAEIVDLTAKVDAKRSADAAKPAVVEKPDYAVNVKDAWQYMDHFGLTATQAAVLLSNGINFGGNGSLQQKAIDEFGMSGDGYKSALKELVSKGLANGRGTVSKAGFEVINKLAFELARVASITIGEFEQKNPRSILSVNGRARWMLTKPVAAEIDAEPAAAEPAKPAFSPEARDQYQRDYAALVQKSSELQDAYIRAGDAGGIDPKTGRAKADLLAEVNALTAQIEAMKDAGQPEPPVVKWAKEIANTFNEQGGEAAAKQMNAIIRNNKLTLGEAAALKSEFEKYVDPIKKAAEFGRMYAKKKSMREAPVYFNEEQAAAFYAAYDKEMGLTNQAEETAKAAQADLVNSPAGQRAAAIADELVKLGWKKEALQDADIGLTKTFTGDQMDKKGRPVEQEQEVTIRLGDTTLSDGGVRFLGTNVEHDQTKTAKSLAEAIDYDGWVASAVHGLNTDDGVDYSTVVDDEDSRFHGKDLRFVRAVLQLEEAVKANGGTVNYGDYEATLSALSLFDSAMPEGYGVIAQVGKGGRLIGRIRIDREGAMTIYAGSAGEAVLAGPVSGDLDIRAAVDSAFSAAPTDPKGESAEAPEGGAAVGAQPSSQAEAGAGPSFAVGDFLTAKFARINKQSTLGEYREQVDSGRFSTDLCKVEKVLTLTNDEYDDMADSLMADDPRLGGGGSASDAPFDFNFDHGLSDWPAEEQAAWDKTSYRLATVVTAPDRTPFVADAQGYKYARYVGVDLKRAADPMLSYKPSGGEQPADKPAAKRVTKKQAREAFDTLSYRVNDLRGHTAMEFARANVPERLGSAMAAVQELVERGWPTGVADPQSLLASAAGQIERWRAEQESGGPKEMGRGDAITYLRNAGLSQEQIDAVLANPTSTRTTEASALMAAITIPSYSREYLDAEIAKAKSAGAGTGTIASQVADVPTRFSIFKLPVDVPAGGVVMNAPRPLLGTSTAEGEFLTGRFYAGIDPSDSYAANWIKENKKLAAVVAEYATMDEQILMALNATEYKSRYLEMLADGKDISGVTKSMVNKIQDRPYSEAMAMLEAARTELAGRSVKKLADDTKEANVPQPEQVAPQEGEAQGAEVPPAADPQRAEDEAFLASVMNGTADMLDEGFAEKLEALYTRWEADPEMSAKATEAVTRYAEFAVSD